MLFPVDDDLDETSFTEGSLHDETMSPDSNHNLQLIAEKRGHARNGFIEDDQEAVKEAIEAMESIRMMNSSRNADDSFDDSLGEGVVLEGGGSQKYYSADTPSSDLVIDERSIGSQTMERLDSPEMSESRHRTEEESSLDKGKPL